MTPPPPSPPRPPTATLPDPQAPVHTARDFWVLEIPPKKVPGPSITPETR